MHFYFTNPTGRMLRMVDAETGEISNPGMLSMSIFNFASMSSSKVQNSRKYLNEQK